MSWSEQKRKNAQKSWSERKRAAAGVQQSPLNEVRAREAAEAAALTSKIPDLAADAKATLSPKAYSDEMSKTGPLWEKFKDVAATAGRYGADIATTKAKSIATGVEKVGHALGAPGRMARNAMQAPFDENTDFDPVGAAKGETGDVRDFKKFLQSNEVGRGALSALDTARTYNPLTGPINAVQRGVAGAFGEEAGKNYREFDENLVLDTLTDPLSYLTTGGGKASEIIPKQVRRVLQASGVDLAQLAKNTPAGTKGVEELVTEAYAHGAGNTNLASHVNYLLRSSGAKDEVIANVIGKNAEFLGKQGTKIGIPFAADSAGVEPGALLTKLSHGKVPEQMLGRASEVLGRHLPGNINLPRHSRIAVQDELARLAHSKDQPSFNAAIENMRLTGSIPTAVADDMLARGDHLFKQGRVPVVDDIINWFKDVQLFGRPGYIPMAASEDALRLSLSGRVNPENFAAAHRGFSGADPALQAQFTRYGLDDATGLGSAQGAQNSLVETAKDLVTFPVPQSLVKKAAQTEGKYVKGAAFTDALAKGESPTTAAKAVRDEFHDNLVPSMNRFIQKAEPVTKRTMPFSGYLGRSMLSMPKLIARRPGVANLPGKVNENLQAQEQNPPAPLYARARGRQTPVPEAVERSIAPDLHMDPSYDLNLQLRGLDPLEPLPVLSLLGDEPSGASMAQYGSPFLSELFAAKNPMTGKPVDLDMTGLLSAYTPGSTELRSSEGQLPLGAGLIGGAMTGQMFQHVANRLARGAGLEGPVIGPQTATGGFNRDSEEKDALALWRIVTGQPLTKTHAMQEAWDIIDQPAVRRTLDTKTRTFKQDVDRAKQKKK